MTKLTVQLPDELKRLAETRSAQAGCADVGEYLARLIQAEASGAPEGLRIDSDAALETLVDDRLEGPWVEADQADFQRMRQKLSSRIDPKPGHQP